MPNQNKTAATQPQHPEIAKRLEEKAKVIHDMLESSETIDLWKLRGLAITEGGLVNDELRRKAWPKLVGIHERYWGGNDTDGSNTDACTVQTDATPKKSNVRHPKEQRIPKKTVQQRPQSFDDSDSSSDLSLRDKVLASSLDFRQIELDVARCTWHLLTGTQRLQRLQMEYKRNRKVAKLIRRKQRRLANLINLTLVKSYKMPLNAPVVARDTTLRYYQGYHDVACIILSTLSGNAPLALQVESAPSLETIAQASGLDLPVCVLLQLSQSHFRDCMRANFNQLQTTMRLTILPLIAYFDPTLHDFLVDCSMEPFFALSWIITWFSHDVRDSGLSKRLFDFFIASHPLMPFYVSVAMVCHPMNRQDVLQAECEFASVHQALAALPRNSSMFGWKYQPGDGYVSDDEQSVHDDESFDSQNSVDTEFILHEEVIQTVQQDKIGAEAVSTVSSSLSTCYDARVPFQEIFDLALVYMERLPPRRLPKLARRYFGRDFVQNLTKQAPGVFQPPPPWTTASVAKSDCALRQKAQQLADLALKSKDDLEFHLQESVSSLSTDIDPVSQPSSVRDPIKRRAIVAAGISSKDDELRRKRRNRIIFFGGAIAVVVVAAMWSSILRRPATAFDMSPDEFGRDEAATIETTTRETIQQNGQTILAASACWESTEQQTFEKELLSFMKINANEVAVSIPKSALVDSSISSRQIISRSLEYVDRVLDLVVDLIFKEALLLGARMSKLSVSLKDGPIATLSEKTRALASHVRAACQKLLEDRRLSGLLLSMVTPFTQAPEKSQPLLPSKEQNRHHGATLLDSAEISTSESPLAVLSRMVANECAINPFCQNILGLSSHLHRIQLAAMRVKNAPGKTLRSAVRKMKPALSSAIGGVSLARYYQPVVHEDAYEEITS